MKYILITMLLLASNFCFTKNHNLEAISKKAKEEIITLKKKIVELQRTVNAYKKYTQKVDAIMRPLFTNLKKALPGAKESIKAIEKFITDSKELHLSLTQKTDEMKHKLDKLDNLFSSSTEVFLQLGANLGYSSIHKLNPSVSARFLIEPFSFAGPGIEFFGSYGILGENNQEEVKFGLGFYWKFKLF